jgi:hypothetical protein
MLQLLVVVWPEYDKQLLHLVGELFESYDDARTGERQNV